LSYLQQFNQQIQQALISQRPYEKEQATNHGSQQHLTQTNPGEIQQMPDQVTQFMQSQSKTKEEGKQLQSQGT
jgi:hypothetical protein